MYRSVNQPNYKILFLIARINNNYIRLIWPVCWLLLVLVECCTSNPSKVFLWN